MKYSPFFFLNSAFAFIILNNNLRVFFLLYLQGRRELSAVVHCYGGGSCKITINSATTAGEVKMVLYLTYLKLVMYQEFVVCNIAGNCITNAENSTIFYFKSVST